MTDADETSTDTSSSTGTGVTLTTEGDAPRRGVHPAVVGALAVALVAALVGLGLMWRALDQEKDRDAALDDAVRTAREVAVAMASYDYRSVDKDFAWVDEAGTKKFKEVFSGVVETIKPVIVQNNGHADATVMKAAGELDGDTKATVLLFVDQDISDNSQDEPFTELSRVEMNLVLQGDRWLVDKVTTYNYATTAS